MALFMFFDVKIIYRQWMITFFFFLPKGADLTPFDFKIPMHNGGGIDCPQEPSECLFGKNFKLILAGDVGKRI